MSQDEADEMLDVFELLTGNETFIRQLRDGWEKYLEIYASQRERKKTSEKTEKCLNK